jgi:thymidylate synthase
LVSAWNVGELEQMALPPCHVMHQYMVLEGKLNCAVTQRSADCFLGIPFNIASYALLTHMIAQVCGLGVGELIFNLGNTHIYTNHLEQVKEQLGRTPYPLPKLELNPAIKDIDSFKFEDIKLIDYKCHPVIKGEVAV